MKHFLSNISNALKETIMKTYAEVEYICWNVPGIVRRVVLGAYCDYSCVNSRYRDPPLQFYFGYPVVEYLLQGKSNYKPHRVVKIITMIQGSKG